MPEKLSWLVLKLIALSALTMFVWGVFGFIEYFFRFSIIPLQNPDFLPGTQFLHWLLITSSGVVLLFGFVTKWRRTPTAMLVMYAMLGTMCFIQTFDMMTSQSRYLAYGIEIALYVAISSFLFRAKTSKAYFSALKPSELGQRTAQQSLRILKK
ncbi:MAG: hypothetical protein V2I45_09255 [Halieaceae bacterium]|jgi:hypothetical protein|nr:hypothetical protein [Halieaceae bacterium]